MFSSGESILRGVTPAFIETFDIARECGILGELVSKSRLIETRRLPDNEARETGILDDRLRAVLLHRRLELVTFPYEWTFSMLADAAIVTLEIQLALLQHGLGLKDASAFNIQFDGSSPVLIDVTSIHKPERLDVWEALGQFGQMFTYPLMLARYRGWDLRSYFMGHLNGHDVLRVAQASGWTRWHPRNLLDVTIPALLQRLTGAVHAVPSRSSSTPLAQTLNLRRLLLKISRLRQGYQPTSRWSHYDAPGYTPDARQAKCDVVRTLLMRTSPETVLDIGCNTGQFSVLAAECGARVIAIDADHDAVDVLYRKLAGGSGWIQPLVIDVTNPSPAVGFRNTERPAVLERIRADCVLALGVIHHLFVDGNLPLEAIRDQLFSLTRRHVILEFIPREDDMFGQLSRGRRMDFESYTHKRVRAVLEGCFRIESDQAIAGSQRRMLLLRRR